MKSIRSSKLDLAAACAASTEEGPWSSGGMREPADLGHAGHECWTWTISHGPGAVDLETSEVAAKWQVDQDELDRLMRWCWMEWADLKKYFPKPQTEVALDWAWPEIRLTGHLDVFVKIGTEARICDGKTGRIEGDHHHQLRGYAWLVFCNHPEVEQVRICIWRWRKKKADWEVYKRQDLEAWWIWMTRHLQESNIFRRGPHCAFCPRGSTCPEKTAYLLQCVESFLGAHPVTVPHDPKQLEEVALRARILKQHAENVWNTIKAHVASQGGKIGNLEIVQERRTEIDVSRGWPTLVEAIGYDKLVQLLEVSKTKVAKAIGDTAPYRQKNKKVGAVMKQLDQAFALSSSTITKLEITKGTTHVESYAVPAIGHDPEPAVGTSEG